MRQEEHSVKSYRIPCLFSFSFHVEYGTYVLYGFFCAVRNYSIIQLEAFLSIKLEGVMALVFLYGVCLAVKQTAVPG